MHLLSLLGLFAVSTQNDVGERLDRLEATVQNLVDLVQNIAAPSAKFQTERLDTPRRTLEETSKTVSKIVYVLGGSNTKYPGYGCLSGENHKVLHDFTLEQCQDSCTKSDTCKSIDFYVDREGHTCSLSNSDFKTVKSTTSTKDCRYYEKTIVEESVTVKQEPQTTSTTGKPKPLDLENFKGVFVKTGNAVVSLGEKSDIALARTGEGKLVIQAKSIDLASEVTVYGQPVRQDLADSLEAQIKDIQKELGVLSKAVAENTKNGLCNKQRDILVGYMPKGSLAHQKSSAVPGVKLSDSEINTIRGKWSTSIFKVTCGTCTAYVKQDRAFTAKGYTKANTKLSTCSKSPDGPFKDYGYHGHNLHFGIDCWNLPTGAGLVYEDNNGGGCNCKGSGRSSGTLTVMNARYCEEVKP